MEVAELKELMIQLVDDQNDKLKEILDEQRKTVIQTTKTNGRVDALSKWKDEAEKRITDLNNKSNKTEGRDGVIWFVIITIVGVLGWVAQKIVTIQIPIHK